MAAKSFNATEWKKIMNLLQKEPQKYGFPERVYGSIILGSFNIRKLGRVAARNSQTWQFLAHVCRQFDLIAIQEIMDDLGGIRKLMELLGPEFGLIVSDKTGAFPGEPGLGERLGFIYQWRQVQRTEVATDVTYDRSKTLSVLTENREDIDNAIIEFQKKMQAFNAKKIKTKPNLKMPVFLTFIRQPFCVSFKITGHPGTKPYEFMAINAHLFFGKFLQDRRLEFDALSDWIMERVKEDHKAYYPNFILLGDLNLDFNDPRTDRARIEKHIKTFDKSAGKKVNVNFPLLDIHPQRKSHFRTNARMSETFDHIGLFFREKGLPTFEDNEKMGVNSRGPDFGVFNFVELFHDALGLKKPLNEMTKKARSDFFTRFEHKVSDHMPIWLRLPLPDK